MLKKFLEYWDLALIWIAWLMIGGILCVALATRFEADAATRPGDASPRAAQHEFLGAAIAAQGNAAVVQIRAAAKEDMKSQLRLPDLAAP